MIRYLSFFFIIFLYSNYAISQTPSNFGYSAIALDKQQNAITNQNVCIKIIIGTYSELHFTKTNYSGAFYILIGSGKFSNGDFLNINWLTSNSIILKIAQWNTTTFYVPQETDYFFQGTSKLYSVPYSLTSKYLEDSSLYFKNRDTINFVNIFNQQQIFGKKIFSADLAANGILIGKGMGNIESNTVFGNSSAINNRTGFRNSFFGYKSGMMNTTGKENDFFGYIAGKSNTTGSWNEFFGSYAGEANTTGSGNSFFGSGSGASNINGGANTFLGYGSGNENINGNENLLAGYYAAPKLNDSNNVILGAYSGVGLRTGKNNIILGYFSSLGLTKGSSNTIIGANVRLDSIVNNNIIISDGEGNVKLKHDSKNWNLYDDQYIGGNSINFNPKFIEFNSTSNIPPSYILHGLIVVNSYDDVDLYLPNLIQIENEIKHSFNIGTSLIFSVINKSLSNNVNIMLPQEITTSFSPVIGSFNSVISPINKIGTFKLIYLTSQACLIQRLY
jgi:hypothetical protein